MNRYMLEDDAGIYNSYVKKEYVKDLLFPRYIRLHFATW